MISPIINEYLMKQMSYPINVETISIASSIKNLSKKYDQKAVEDVERQINLFLNNLKKNVEIVSSKKREENNKSYGLQKKPTQCGRVLQILIEANGSFVDGTTFLRLPSPILQYHARIFELQKKGYNIEADWVDGKNWKKYRLIQ